MGKLRDMFSRTAEPGEWEVSMVRTWMVEPTVLSGDHSPMLTRSILLDDLLAAFVAWAAQLTIVP